MNLIKSLTDQERKLFASYLRQDAAANKMLITQMRRMGPGFGLVADKMQKETDAEELVASKLEAVESYSV